MSIEYSAFESGLDRFIRFDKASNFIGKEALQDWHKNGFENAFITLEVHDIHDADARGSEAMYKDGELVGRATSGGYGFRVEKSLALGLVKPEVAIVGNTLEIEILGHLYHATILAESPYDPENVKLRE
jgi:dimethylglycine dehydrogenase